MRKIIVFALIAFLFASFAPAARTDTGTLMLVRVHVSSDDQAAYLMSNFDESHNHSHDEIELVLWPGDLARLEALGYPYEVVIEDLVAYARANPTAADAPQRLPGPDRSDYRVLADYNSELKALAKKNPGLVKLFEMKRPSLEGRPVFGVEIAHKVKDEDGRPIFYIDGVHHAREWPASEFTMLFAHYLADRFGKDPEVTSVLKRSRVIVVPVVNVDGFDYSRTSPVQAQGATSLPLAVAGAESYWRKNRRSFTGVTIPEVQKNPDAYGVDPNRNYAYLWGDQQGGSSNEHVSQTYRGEAPFSEPEPSNVRDILLGRNVVSVITNHTYQASVLRAGGGDAPEDALLTRIGQEMADVLQFRNSPTVGYPTTGTTDDYAYANTGALGFTIEHGNINFHPPYKDGVGVPAARTMRAFMVLAKVTADPRYHSVITGRVAGGKAELVLKKSFKTPLSPGNPTGEKFFPEKIELHLTTDADGTFEWHVGPSTRPWAANKPESYTLVVKSGGQTRELEVVVKRGERLNLGTIRL